MKMAVTSGIFLIATLAVLAGCPSFPRYQHVTDGLDRKIYYVAGRVMDSSRHPVTNCAIFLTKVNTGLSNRPFETIPVATTDIAGNYSFAFELSGATNFWIYFNAKDQNFLSRYVNFTHLLESTMFQYTGNNPVVVNVVMIKRGHSPLPQEDVAPGSPPQPIRPGDRQYGPDV